MRAIFFDWDGTLADTCGMVLGAHNHVRTEMGLEPWAMNDLLGGGGSSRQMYPQIYGDRSVEALALLYAYMEEKHIGYLREAAGAEELLAYLFSLGVPMGVVSNKRHDLLEKEIEHLGWGRYFGSVVGAGEAIEDKPSSAPLELALARHGGVPEGAEIWYAGDTELDLLCATGVGARMIYIRKDGGCPDLIARYRPDIVVRDLEALRGHDLLFGEGDFVKEAC